LGNPRSCQRRMLGRRKGEGLGLAASGETRGQNVPDRQPCGGLSVDRPDHAMPGTALWVFLHPGFPSGFGPTPSEPSPLSASLAMESFPATLVRRAGDRYSHDAAARLRGARDGIISGPDASGCHGSRAAAGRPASWQTGDRFSATRRSGGWTRPPLSPFRSSGLIPPFSSAATARVSSPSLRGTPTSWVSPGSPFAAVVRSRTFQDGECRRSTGECSWCETLPANDTHGSN
jgi:hypothetical protein